ncbi:tetratricopeptide (TPR) repeat protein [Rhizomicrobium palustre]|uniref:Tetratricopeptide (TPR) repeat protein n=1 Tax=Rhizomicrobium palustre TaxID=189966 RepID=A0A846MUF1_9PROT|nr:sulfotransferase [Rhizomicrobium palustre]NIK86831.1 tetratricopeptide (TPR) repeat protein [Rhizomicrobium palustre]
MSLADDLLTGKRFFDVGRYDAALICFERILAQAPNQYDAMRAMVITLNAMGRAADALEVCEKARRHHGKRPEYYHLAAQSLEQLGRIDEARRAFEEAIALAPAAVHHYYGLSRLVRFRPGDFYLDKLEMLAKNIYRLSDVEKIELHFALGKAYDDLGRVEEAFHHFAAGNLLRRAQIQYDEAMWLGLFQAMQDVFTPEAIAAFHGVGDPSDVPIFVIGMPRSGTTLVEQILASHPKVFGAGEPLYLHQFLGQGLLGADFPHSLAALKPADLRRFGGTYATRLKTHAPEAARIVDKLPTNFVLAGLIHLVLPRARILHVKRDPLDTCFSCFANLFSQQIDYSYDLGELGRYYRGYAVLMEHWHRVLPPGTILDVSYERLVADFETEARRIVAHVGLEWNPDCLDFYRTDRVVHTLSAAQVREPLYARAVGRAAPYQPFLEPLRNALREG